MYTHKDIDIRTIFIINCIEHERSLRVSNGEFLLEEKNDSTVKTLTKIPFQKLLALFVIGHITVTSPLIEKCKAFNVALVVMKPNLRPVFYWADSAEGNFLLRKRQYHFAEDDLSIARLLVENKIENQRALLLRTRRKDTLTLNAVAQCDAAINTLADITDYNKLMGMEGVVSKMFFQAYYQELDWNKRLPRAKIDIMNTVLDIGYTILFNYIESYIRMFGFDLYVGVYHRNWYKRKSLVCDLMEPFRCIIDHAILLAFNRKQFKKSDFKLYKSEYFLKNECYSEYYKVFFNALIVYKMEIYHYIQSYYRFFMQKKSQKTFPKFCLKK